MELLQRKHCLVTPSMLTVSTRGVELGASYWRGEEKRRAARTALGSIFKNGIEKGQDNSFQPFHLWGRGYYHFLTEIAPKLLRYEQEIKQGTLLIPEPTKFISEFLDLFGFTGTPVTKCQYFSNLSIITNLKEGHHDPEIISNLRDRIFDVLNIKHGKGRKVYISRSKASRRRVTNDEEVSRELSKQGFEVVHFEDMSFAEQVRLMAETDVAIGLHGAGLTNIMFMPPGGKVFEYFPESGGNPCFKSLAHHLDHQFVYCKRTNESEPYNFHLNDVIAPLPKQATAPNK